MALPSDPGSGTGSWNWNRAVNKASTRWRHAKRDIQRKLTWSRLYRTTSYMRSALWIVPFNAILLVLIFGPIIRAVDAALGWHLTGLGVKGAEALYQTVITLSLSFLVFTFGSLLVAIQIAGGQLTPRIIATTLLRDNVVRYTVGLLVFALMFSVTALNRLEETVLDLVATIVALLGITSTAAFLFLIDYAARLLRPVSILARVSEEALGVINVVYPDEARDDGDERGTFADLPASPRRAVGHIGHSSILLAADLDTLMKEARRTRGTVELIPEVGDFVASGDPLFVLYGGAVSIEDRQLHSAVALGPERTIEQDPMFGFRILVDIGLKALSPAINDPTTAVLALDQLQRLLRVVGRRRLRGEVLADGLGKPRVVYHTPNWEDFVQVACTEIRACGANNVQVARRMRAMLVNLAAGLPAHRHAAIDEELRKLDQTLRPLYPIAEDLALASIPDLQGLGGSARRRPVADR